MTIVVKKAVIHHIEKNRNETPNLRLRDKTHPHSVELDKFVTEVVNNSTVNRGSSVCKIFTQDDTFAQSYVKHFIKETEETEETEETFISFSKELVASLSQHMITSVFTTGGNIPMLHYTKDDVNYVMIAVVTPESGVTINETTGVVESITHISKEAIRFALNINIDGLIAHYSLYSSGKVMDDEALENITSYAFWTQKSKETKLSDYFQNFLPVHRRIDDTKSTRDTHTAIRKYLDVKITDEAVRSDTYNRIVRVLYDKASNHEIVYLDEDILTIINSFEIQSPESFNDSVSNFSEFCKEQDLSYQGSFSPNKETVEKYVKFKNIKLGNSIKFSGDTKEFKNKARIKRYAHAPSKLFIDLTEGDERALLSEFGDTLLVPDSNS